MRIRGEEDRRAMAVARSLHLHPPRAGGSGEDCEGGGYKSELRFEAEGRKENKGYSWNREIDWGGVAD